MRRAPSSSSPPRTTGWWPPEESQSLYDHAGEPKKLIVLKGYGHYDVYAEPAFGEVMAATLSWYRAHLPAQALDAPTTG